MNDCVLLFLGQSGKIPPGKPGKYGLFQFVPLIPCKVSSLVRLKVYEIGRGRGQTPPRMFTVWVPKTLVDGKV